MDPVLLIFAGLAAFVIYRLISILGTRTGHEQRPEAFRRPAKATESHVESAPASRANKPAPASASAAPLQAADPHFDEKAFLTGARVAYEMIVEAFAAGDLKSIRRFLGQSVYDAFRAAIAEREAKHLTSELKFVGIESASIIKSGVEGDSMFAVTEFASNQVRVTRDKDGVVVEGDPARIDLVKDQWTFSRKISSSDPNWTLVATGGSA
ncbi:MAG: Tim44/TimA family putative adaptor protein [Alphaproteobacteria bacterium]|nr:Tim44/TimA family putative adaptor protein [Alphaproteobacteria bacterium]